MEKYKHITKMEDILNSQSELIEKMDTFLNEYRDSFKDYKSLVNYYYSRQRRKDLRDDEKGLIPSDLNRGVLSEDAIYNMMIDRYELAVKMLEAATIMIKDR